ncbi:interstitial collagenase-like [Diadema setosum]|uniref:interstitial collagenase-like n=1 Tax=Diadema setosum TaxID=31175 RepID=UPI003B3A7CD5
MGVFKVTISRRHEGRVSKHALLVTILYSAVFFLQSASSVTLSRNAVDKHLKNLDYTGDMSATLPEERRKHVLHGFQTLSGLHKTAGVNDKQTLKLMAAPHRGNGDVNAPVRVEVLDNWEGRTREKRWSIFRAWPKNNFTYRISSYTPDLPEQKVDEAIENGFKLWSAVALVDFRRVWTGDADIDISFQRGDHGDGKPFDGPGYVLAHSFVPHLSSDQSGLTGNIHLDEDENWTVESPSGTNLMFTIAHEIGHAIGLSHSKVVPALMYPWYQSYEPSLQLHEDDIRGVQFLYGARPGTELSYPALIPGGPNNPSVPNLCASLPEAMTLGRDGVTYAFKDIYYWKMEDGLIVQGYPALISQNWPGLQSYLTAALTVKNTRVWGEDAGKTYFFKQRAVWRFTPDNALDPGFPKDIHTVFPSVRSTVSSVDAAVEIGGNGETLFVIDGELYKYGWTKNFSGPFAVDQVIPNLHGIVKTVIQGPDNYLYFFMDDGMYYQVSPWSLSVSARFPKAASQDWFSCEDELRRRR